MLIKKIVRLKLTDFIDTNIEDNVIDFLHMIKEATPTFVVHCWYEKSDMKPKDVTAFTQKYYDRLELIEMSFYPLVSYETSVWYDIINVKDAALLSHYKFRSTYESNNEIINCILEFNNVIKFDTQKNIGYNKNGYNKDAKNSNNRFKKMGKQT